MQAKLSQGELAEKIGVTQAVMSRIELGRRQLTLQELETLAEFFNVPIESLLKDKVTLDELYKRGDLARLADQNGNVGETQEATVRVPVFDIEAGYTVSFDDGGHPVGHSDKYQLLSPADVASPSFFGCDLHGDSMQQAGEPSFRDGDRLFFDPSRSVGHGGFAFVRTADDTATFKQIFFDSETTVRLHPLNSRYADTVLKRKDIIAMWPLVFRIQKF